jgi:hypothetical protein
VLQRQFGIRPAADGWYEIAQTEVIDASIVSADCTVAVQSPVPVCVDDVAIVQLP